MAKELVHTLFARKATETPDLIALSVSGENIRYALLNKKSSRLSHVLQSVDLVPGDVVGTLLPSGIDLVCSVLGIMKVGGVYMPMDEGYSDRRLEQMLQESGAKVLILTATDRLFVEALLARSAHRVEHLIVEGVQDEGLEVFRVIAGEYVRLDVSLSDQLATDPGVEVGFDSPCYIYYTSGSSGRSKGIKGSYGSLSHYVQWHAREWGLGAGSRVAQFCSPGFDAWLKDVLPTLISGGTVCLVPKGVRSNIGLLSSWLEDSEVTQLQTVPSVFRLLTANLKATGKTLSSLKQVVLAGEPLYGQDVLHWRGVQGDDTQLANMYGLTETTILKTFYRIPLGDWAPGDVIPVGEAISNTRIAVIHAGGLCLNGELGEVYIKSPYVTLGYLDPALNAGLFVQNPLSLEEDIICRTGDIGRINTSGALEILGREDDQVKIHGVRIELSEVRNALYELGGIERVELVVHQGDDNNRELLCYYTGVARPAGDLREALGVLLPSMYLPSHYLWLEAFPLTLNGKVDRKKLPRPDSVLGVESFEAPVGEVEVGLARVWSQVLGRAEVGRRDSFFNLGGSSLKVIQLISWIYKEYEVQLSIGDIFSNAQLSAQAELIRGARHTAYQAIEKVAEQDSYALSPSQLRMWLLEQRENDALPFNGLMFYRFTGALDYAALERSFQTLLERHESLRTVFIQKEGAPRQRIIPVDALGFKIAHHDLRDAADAQARAVAMGHQVRLKRFSLSEGPLLRVGLYRLSEDIHLLMLCAHHLITDGWSMQIQSRELITLYNAYTGGQGSPLAPLSIQYKDYAAWQLSQLRGAELERCSRYWLDQFSDEVPLLSLPSDRPRPAVPTFRGAEYRFTFSADQSAGLKALLSAQGATLFMGLNALLVTLLYRYTGTRDIVIGAPVAGRDHPDLEDQIGPYLNTLALRYRFDADENFSGLLTQVRQIVLGGFDHQVYPFDYLIDALGLDTELNRSVLFDVALILQNIDVNLSEIEGLSLEVLPEDLSIAKGDIRFQFEESDDGLQGSIEYTTDLYDGDRIRRMASDLTHLLDAVLSDPTVALSDLEYRAAEEQAAGAGFTDVLPFEQQASLPSRLQKSFATHKSLPAVVLAGESITYGELSLASNRLSHLLQSLGFVAGDVAGTLLPSGIDLVCSVVGIMKVGGVYMPLDEGYSDRRLAQMLQESGAKVLILTATDRLFVEALLARCEHRVEYLVVFPSIVSELMEGLKVAGIDLIAASSTGLEVFRVVAGDYVQVEVSLSDQPTTDPAIEVDFESPCYIFYTSGSSGRSKGIKGRYGSLSHYVQWHADAWAFGVGSRVSQFCSPGFDAWLKDVFPTLISGGTVCIVPKDVRSNLGRLSAWLNDSRVTHLQTVPSIFRLLTASLKVAGATLPSLEQVVLAGEPLYGQDVLNWRSVQGEQTQLANMYGLTETTILKSFYRIPWGDWAPGEMIPVGEPISHTQIAVINEGGLCLHGELGEVYIKSPYVTLGYLDASLNAKLFVQNPLSVEDDIVCRTGDIGRINGAGALEILGREDDQVKIHGVRIELSEVRSALYELGGIERVELIVHQGDDNNRELLCYYTGVSRPAGDLREGLGALLPSMYLPGHYLWLESFPLTLNGKVDRKKLPRLDSIVGSASFEAPSDALEQGLARVWSQVLGRAEIGRRDSFFNLGGSSLKVIQLISWIYKEYEVQLSIGDVFSHPQLFTLAELIRGARRTAYQAIDKVTEQENYALSPSQLRLWLQEQRENDALPFNGLLFFRFTGALDYAALERSFETLLERHESLRTVFVQQSGVPRQRVVSVSSLGFAVAHHDLRGVADAAAHAVALGHQVRLKRFSLSEGPLLRVGLYRLAEDIHLLMLCSHHLITDGWSMQIQSRELITLYNAYTRRQENPLVPLPIQYKDYAAWQLSQLRGAELERCSRYWLDQFSDEVPMLSLPSDRPRPAVPTFRGAEYRFTFSADQSAGLKALLSAQGATLFMGLNALLVTLLYRYTGTRDIVIGAPVAGRDHPDLENQIGPYLNTLAFRYRFDAGENFSGLLTQVRQIVLGGFDHQVYPFDYLMDALGVDTELNRSVLFDVALVLQNIEVNRSAQDLAAEGLLVEVLPEELSIAKGDIRFQFEEGDDGLQGSIEYTTDLYDADRIQRMASDLTHLLESILSDPTTPLSDLEYLSLEEQKAGEGFNDVLPVAQQEPVQLLLGNFFASHKSVFETD